LIILW